MLLTPRLRLRPFANSDLDDLHALYGDAEAMRYWTFPPSRDRAETARRLRWHVGRYQPASHASWAVTPRRGQQCIGMVTFHHREPRDHRLEVGYILARAHWGRGLATEAVAALLRHCIDSLGTHRVEAMIAAENAASRRLAERLGFSYEGGPLRDRWRVGDSYRSVVVYGLIAGQEKTAPRPGAARGKSA
ncbi:MAG TPA: GNAT family N-acetyltransferase [Vineibacter sp.]|nr:GNAT family N-acetyltransferase [Vineibacter sp.]